jgi:hypothetical protein
MFEGEKISHPLDHERRGLKRGEPPSGAKRGERGKRRTLPPGTFPETPSNGGVIFFERAKKNAEGEKSGDSF